MKCSCLENYKTKNAANPKLLNSCLLLLFFLADFPLEYVSQGAETLSANLNSFGNLHFHGSNTFQGSQAFQGSKAFHEQETGKFKTRASP